MDKLNIDLKSILPHVIDAFTHVYGEEYIAIIQYKIINANIFQYYDLEGLNDYIRDIKEIKKQEMYTEFLKEIGINLENENSLATIDDETKRQLEDIVGPFYAFKKEYERRIPLRAFLSNYRFELEDIVVDKIKVFNFLLGDSHETITEKNYNSFKETNEYQELLIKINEYNKLYDEFSEEYRDFEQKLLPYENFIEQERKRKESILKKKKEELFKEILPKLPQSICDDISNKSLDEQMSIILEPRDLAFTTKIEAFSSEKMAKLKDPQVSEFEKESIKGMQLKFLSQFEIYIPNEELIKYNIDNYLNFLNNDVVKKYIPKEELVDYISAERPKRYEDAIKEYYTTRRDFVEIYKNFEENENNLEHIYEKLKNKIICVNSALGNGTFISFMFYSIGRKMLGSLLFAFMHECGHLIDLSEKGCGFEIDIFSVHDLEKNTYDEAHRKYEKFNETLNDMFTMEALEFLHKQDIYLIEPRKYTSQDESNCNTFLIVKQLLEPLIQKFRKQVIKAKINTNPDELIRYIGNENYEQLVDAVNKVDYLARNGLVSKIDKSPEDEMVLDYYNEVERVKQIYNNIDDYYANNFSNASGEFRKIK